jgi:hypothetical protein
VKRLASVALVWGATGLSACGPTHLELAKVHHADGLRAARRADAPAARGHFEVVLREARESVSAHEEDTPRQAHLLAGSAHLRLGDAKAAHAALGTAHASGLDPAPWFESVLTADACELLRGADAVHAEALCWRRVLDIAPPTEADVRVRAVTEYGNALARRWPHTGELTAYGDPTFRVFLDAALDGPLDVDVLFVLARRLPLFCDDPAFVAAKPGWREFQKDLLKAALFLGWFRVDRTRTEAEAYLRELETRPLCGG